MNELFRWKSTQNLLTNTDKIIYFKSNNSPNYNQQTQNAKINNTIILSVKSS